MKKTATPLKKLESNPVALSKALDFSHSHVILHKQGNGYSFTVFWVNDKASPAEPVASGLKTFKTKSECVKSIKKLYDATPVTLRQYTCFDYNQQRVDTEIKYDVKKLL